MELEFNLGEKKPVVLIGCKSDCAEDREVDYFDGERTAESFSAPYIETSAKKNENVEEAFELILK
jgi:GTPase SAR1 family protein